MYQDMGDCIFSFDEDFEIEKSFYDPGAENRTKSGRELFELDFEDLESLSRRSSRVIRTFDDDNFGNMRQVEMNQNVNDSNMNCWINSSLLDSQSLENNNILFLGSAGESVLSLEDLKNQMNSCVTCGVTWSEDHVSLDCFECGGYSMKRPCPVCDGQCQTTWHRDVVMSHSMRKAHWMGECALNDKARKNACYLKNVVGCTSPDELSDALQDVKINVATKVTSS